MDALESLQALKAYYPNLKSSDPELLVKLWDRELSEFPPGILSWAVSVWVHENPRFPPNLGEFVNLCRQLAQSKLAHDTDVLRQRAYQLEEQGVSGFELAEWLCLANDFDASGRPEAAAHLRAKAHAYADRLVQSQSTES